MQDFWTKVQNEIKEQLTIKGATCLPTQMQVQNRYNCMMRCYKGVKDHNNRSGNGRNNYQYYYQLDEIHHDRPNITPVTTISSSGLGDTRRGEFLNLN